MKLRMMLLFVLLMQCASAAEVLCIDYPSEERNGVAGGYWRGVGTLSTNVDGLVLIEPGDAFNISYTGGFVETAAKRGKESIELTGDGPLNASFTLPPPRGHGVYWINSTLPSSGGVGKVIVNIPEAHALLYSNMPFKTRKRGVVLELEADTTVRRMEILYATEDAYDILAPSATGALYLAAAWPLLILRRRRLLAGLASIRKQYFTSDRRGLAFALLIIVLMLSYGPRFPYAVPLYLTLALSAYYAFIVLTALLLLATLDKKTRIRDLSLTGGLLVFIKTAYLGFTGVLASAGAGLLIYLLHNVLVSESSK